MSISSSLYSPDGATSSSITAAIDRLAGGKATLKKGRATTDGREKTKAMSVPLAAGWDATVREEETEVFFDVLEQYGNKLEVQGIVWKLDSLGSTNILIRDWYFYPEADQRVAVGLTFNTGEPAANWIFNHMDESNNYNATPASFEHSWSGGVGEAVRITVISEVNENNNGGFIRVSYVQSVAGIVIKDIQESPYVTPLIEDGDWLFPTPILRMLTSTVTGGPAISFYDVRLQFPNGLYPLRTGPTQSPLVSVLMGFRALGGVGFSLLPVSNLYSYVQVYTYESLPSSVGTRRDTNGIYWAASTSGVMAAATAVFHCDVSNMYTDSPCYVQIRFGGQGLVLTTGAAVALGLYTVRLGV